jgi:hypothetical protein
MQYGRDDGYYDGKNTQGERRGITEFGLSIYVYKRRLQEQYIRK